MAIGLAKTGFTTVTLATIDADAYAAKFQMDKGIHYKRILEICAKAGPILGYSKPAMLLLTTLFSYTREIDWHDGRPICFASNERLAADIGLTVSSVKKQMRELNNLGLISRSETSNGKRSGGRHTTGPRKGHLLDITVGINLAPLAAKFHDHEIAIEQFEKNYSKLQKMKREALRFTRNIGQMYEQCLHLNIAENRWLDIATLTDSLAPKIKDAAHSRSLEKMMNVWQQLGEANKKLTDLLHKHFSETQPNKLTPQGGKNDPQITSTSTESPSGDIKAYQGSRSGEGSVSNSPSDPPEKEHEITFTQYGDISSSEIPHLFPSVAEFICIDEKKKDSRSWEALGKAISSHGHNLIHLKRDLWIKALAELPLGYAQIMFAITLEWNVNNPSKNAGGYFMGMWAKYHKDELNLWGTIMKRRKMD
ncbi:MAG: hypothetical protein HC843_04420 [Sphingomonadales bacterium]|nr:hypothetical protein [Sphingomonadales bacterium]